MYKIFSPGNAYEHRVYNAHNPLPLDLTILLSVAAAKNCKQQKGKMKQLVIFQNILITLYIQYCTCVTIDMSQNNSFICLQKRSK